MFDLSLTATEEMARQKEIVYLHHGTDGESFGTDAGRKRSVSDRYITAGSVASGLRPLPVQWRVTPTRVSGLR